MNKNINILNFKIKHIIIGLATIIVVLLVLNAFNANNASISEVGESQKLPLRFLKQKEPSDDKINLNELFHFGDCLLKESGKLIVKLRKETPQSESAPSEIDNNIGGLNFDRKKSDNSIVTTADLQSHQIIVHTLNHKFKNLIVNSEESGTNADDERFNVESFMNVCNNYVKKDTDLYAQSSEINVWIDPLDATQEYSENLVEFVTVMFCIVQKGTPRAGIIHRPFNNETLSSFYENRKIKSPSKLETNRIIVSRSHPGEIQSYINQKMKGALIITAAGSGFKTLSVLRNQADLYLHTTLIKKWDICAPNAILNNLNGKLTKLNGEIIDYSTNDKSTVAVEGILAALHNYDYFLNAFKKV